MKASELYDDLVAFCEANADEALVKKYARYFRDGYEAYGLSSDLIHQKAASLLENRDVGLELVLESAPLLVKNGKYEMPVFAVVMLKKFTKQFTPGTFHEIGNWFDIGIRNWAHCDVICGELINVFFAKQLITHEDLAPWRTAANKFKRRAVPVALIKPMKKDRDPARYFPLLEPVMLDTEREVHQGLGWFLREAWKTDPEPTEVFLHRWKNRSARLIFQYATEKMSPEGKAKFRREKKS